MRMCVCVCVCVCLGSEPPVKMFDGCSPRREVFEASAFPFFSAICRECIIKDDIVSRLRSTNAKIGVRRADGIGSGAGR